MATRKGTTQLTKFRKKYPKAVRAALERLFRIWLRKYAPLRFKRQAINKYKHLNKSYKRKYRGQQQYEDKYLRMLAERISKGKDTPDPLRATGKLKRKFLKGSYRFTSSRKYGSLKVKFTGLPKSATKRKAGKKIMDINIPLALTEVTDKEAEELSQLFDRLLRKEFYKIDNKSSFGRIRI